MLERHWIITVSGREWIIVATGFFEPLFYLLSIRIGFSALIGDIDDDGRIIAYANFVAPALMAASAMNGAIYESTMNVFFRLKYDHTYDAALATPLTVGDIALGEIMYATVRGGLYSAAFLVSMVVLGMAESPWILMSLPICVLIAAAFSAVGMAATTYMRTWADFEYVPSITLPLFLFSATFYPLSSYGNFAWVAQLSPLYHGVTLVRASNLGVWSWAHLGHVAVLVTLGFAGLSITARRIERLLMQ